MNKKSKARGILGTVLILVLVCAIVTMNVLCYTYSNMINLYFRSTAETEELDLNEVEARAQAVTTEINAEGTVLLKNDGDLLPITGQVNLFGACSYQQLYLGTGSAGGWNWDSESCLNLKDALAAEGITVNPDLWQFYIDHYTENAGQEGGVANMTGASHNIVEQPLEMYGDELLNSCKASLERLYTCRDNLDFLIKNAKGESNLLAEKAAAAKVKFNTAMDDDLNTPDALAAVFELVKDINTLGADASADALKAAAATFDELTGVLGLLYNRKTDEIPAEVMDLVNQRAAAKKAKDWPTADALRAKITEMGYVVEDTPQGPKVTRA